MRNFGCRNNRKPVSINTSHRTVPCDSTDINLIKQVLTVTTIIQDIGKTTNQTVENVDVLIAVL